MPKSFRRLRFRAVCVVLLATLGLLAAACGTGEQQKSAGGSKSITVAIGVTEEVDPDVFFDLELGSLTNAVYDGLVRYKPNTVEIEGVLAKSWDISADGLTFTFHLRDGIKFADGTPITSAEIKSAFERKAALKEAPSYILSEVAGYETPDPKTFVIKLSKPVNNFMFRMASPAGSLITNAKVVKEHAKGNDLAKGWMGTHSAGSGPYEIASFVPDDRIVLKANPNYWGTKPAYDQIVLKVIPDTSSAQLQTEQGDVDLMSGLGPAAAQQITSQQKIALTPIQGYNLMFYQVNVTKPPFDDPAVVKALQETIPYEDIVSTVLGKYGTVADQLAPTGVMPKGKALYAPKADANALKALPAAKKGTVTIGQFTPDTAQIFARTNDYIAGVLRDAGFKVRTVAVPNADYFGMIGAPEKAPSLMLSNQPGDGAQPANWFDLFLRTDGALNVGGVGNAEVDKLLDEGNAVPSGKDPDYDAYSKASDLARDQGWIIPIANVNTLYAHSKQLTGVEMHLVLSPAIWLADLKPTAGS